MASVDIIFNGITTTIQCKENEYIEEILKRFCLKVDQNKEEISFIYGGDIIKENKTFNEVANSEDKQRKKMSILVTSNKTTIYKKSNLKKSKYILCLKCNEPIRIEIKDFKIKLFGCKNGHTIDNLPFIELNKFQLVDESKIICEECKNISKAKTYDNVFFICNTCNKNICPLCKSSHDKKHNIIEYDEKYFKCNIHNELYSSYCHNCNKHICVLCEKKHSNHVTISLGQILPDEDKLKEERNNLKNIIDRFKQNINEIINNLNNLLLNIDSYFNIYNDIINEYDVKKRNYYILQNIKDINNYNTGIINDLNNIINDKDIISKFKNIIIIYNKIYLDKTKLIVSNVEKIEIGKQNKMNEVKDKCENNIKDKGLYQIKIYDNGRYEGEIKNGILEGKGIYYLNNGDRYEGDFKNNKIEGKGIFYYNDGDRYEGDFKNDKKEGKGIYYFHCGDRYEGDYKNDLKEGKGIYYGADGSRYEGYYKNDKYD